MTRFNIQRLVSVVCLLIGIDVLVGCSPAFNWRVVRPAQTTLQTMFPCKPEQTARAVVMGGNKVDMTMLSCEIGDASFSLMYADMKDTLGLNAALLGWRQTTLANMRALLAEEGGYLLIGAKAPVPVFKVTAHASRMDGSTISVNAIWFALGTQVFQATVTAKVVNSEVFETFLSGIRTQ